MERVKGVLIGLFGMLVLLQSGCSQQAIQRSNGASTARAFTLANVAKSEVDMVAELTQQEVLKGLRLLADKLYRRNPQEYRKAGLASPEAASARLFDPLGNWQRAPMARSSWEHNFRLAFDGGYQGDRVEVFMSALTIMVMAAYNHRTEFFLTDELDAQKLYNSARNIETVVWKLSKARYPDGTPFLLTNSMDGEAQNLSFEREFGKLIAQQDLLALIMEDRSNRVIARALQSTATFVFLPI
jgi:hypothetical protein